MYIIDDTYFKSPKREIANLNEADSKSFVELESLIDEKCRLLLFDFLTVEQAQELDSYLVNGLFPVDPTTPVLVPQKWIDLVNGKTYTKNDVELIWSGLKYAKGTYKGSLMADYVYSFWIETQNSYMTGVGDAKANPKGANLVNPTQRWVKSWNDFTIAYQDVWSYSRGYSWFNYHLYPQCYRQNYEVSLIQFLQDHDEVYPNDNRKFFSIENQLGL